MRRQKIISLVKEESSPSVNPVRVLIVDDHEVVRMGLRAALCRGGSITVVGEADNAKNAIREAVDLKPDVVLMDVRLSGDNGVDACRAIRDSCPVRLAEWPKDARLLLDGHPDSGVGYLKPQRTFTLHCVFASDLYNYLTALGKLDRVASIFNLFLNQNTRRQPPALTEDARMETSTPNENRTLPFCTYNQRHIQYYP